MKTEDNNKATATIEFDDSIRIIKLRTLISIQEKIAVNKDDVNQIRILFSGKNLLEWLYKCEINISTAELSEVQELCREFVQTLSDFKKKINNYNLLK